ncbi:MAG TPA: pilus assembly PilX N-terminal domain-containing protein [Acidobacteriota bacterium]|jgi:Tfp pilus assembly protein PilX
MNNQKGAALIFVMIGLALLTLVGLALAFQSSTEYNISNNFITSQQALAIADGGIAVGKSYLRGKDFNTVLAKTTDVPAFASDAQSEEGTFAGRNPIGRLTARSFKFDAYSSTQTATALPALSLVTSAISGSKWTVRGYIGQPGGNALGDGLYFLKLSDNKDEAAIQDYTHDIDNKVYMRSVGVHRVDKSDKANGSGRTQASVAVIEALFKRDQSFNIQSPFAVQGPSVNARFDGNSFDIDGRNYNGLTPDQIRAGGGKPSDIGAVPGIGGINDTGSGPLTDSITSALSGNQGDNIKGVDANGVPVTPAVGDITSGVKSGGDSANVLDPNWIGNFIDLIGGIGDITYNGDTTLSGSGITLGTDADPKLTIVNGDLHVSGSGGGAGVLIVTGNMDYQGSFDFNGVIIVLGETLDIGGANKSIIGGLFYANLDKDGSNYSWGPASFNIHGNSNFYYRSDSIKMGWSLLPLKVLSWREVPPELDKVGN